MCLDNLKTNQRSYYNLLNSAFEADFLWKVSLKILNSGLILKTFTNVYIAKLYRYFLQISEMRSFGFFKFQSIAMVMSGRSVHLTTLFSWASLTKPLTSTSCTYFRLYLTTTSLLESAKGRRMAINIIFLTSDVSILVWFDFFTSHQQSFS